MLTAERERLMEKIGSIPDPEIPVITISELGILRGMEFSDAGVEVRITPTYSGCPAMHAIEKEITELLKGEDVGDVKVKLVYAPVWTTDWLSEEAKEKLRAYGIAPPERATSDKGVLLPELRQLACPRCGAKDTRRISEFGSTACKALYACNACGEPFDHFKCH